MKKMSDKKIKKKKWNYKRGHCILCEKLTTKTYGGNWCCKDCEIEKPILPNKSIALDVREERDSRKIDLIGFGDWHYGGKECNVEKIIEDIKWIKDNPFARVILMGDMINCGTKLSIGGGRMDDTMNAQEQFETVIQLLQPIKKRIYGVHVGNHEQRIYNETGVNLSKMMAKELGTRYLGYSAFHLIKVKNQNYTIFSTHGSSGATLPHTKIKRCLDLATFIDADIYLMGHVHALQVQTQEVKRVDMRKRTIIKERKNFVLTGHYLNYEDSYADQKNMRPSEQGCAKIRIGGDKHSIFVSI